MPQHLYSVISNPTKIQSVVMTSWIVKKYKEYKSFVRRPIYIVKYNIFMKRPTYLVTIAPSEFRYSSSY